jgi:hypothetical protein
MKLKYLYTAITILIFAFKYTTSVAQLGVKENNSAPNSSAMLDVESANKGWLIPRMSASTRDGIGSPPVSLMVYNTSSNRFNFWNGSKWSDFNTNILTFPFTGSGSNNIGGQDGLFKIINTSTGNAFYVKSGLGAQIVAAQPYAAYFESSENGVFAGGGSGKLALKTSGTLVIRQNNEGLNKILTSIDADGTARWESAATLTGLDLNGTTTLGINGTPFTEIIKVSMSGNIGNMTPGGTGTITFNITNAQPGSTVFISPTNNLPDGILITHALCEAANAVEIKFFNANSIDVDPASQVYHLAIIR